MNLETERVGRFQLTGEWPPELLPLIRDLLTQYQGYLPAWCEKALVFYDDENEAIAMCDTDCKYRKVQFWFSQGFFLQNEEKRRYSFTHEIAHANSNALYTCAFELLEEALKDNDLAFTFAKQRLTEANEAGNCDFTALLMRLENREKTI